MSNVLGIKLITGSAMKSVTTKLVDSMDKIVDILIALDVARIVYGVKLVIHIAIPNAII